MSNTASLRKLLETPFWPDTLRTGEFYQRYEDDSPLGNISVVVGGDGDAHLSVIQELDPNDRHLSMRFRMPMTGGGQSPRVRNALLFLAEAIRLDNLENPQNRV
jgi:hypothetical protein